MATVTESRKTASKETTGVVRVERLLPHPPRRVWRALTRPEALDRWLLPVAPEGGAGKSLDTPGERLTLRAAPNVRVAYQVTESEPERRLSLRWRVAAEMGREDEEASQVTWTLTPEQDGQATRLVVEHTLAEGAGGLTAHLGGAAMRLSAYLELGQIQISRGRSKRAQRCGGFAVTRDAGIRRGQRELLCR